jgi:hypothetical protein
VAIKFATEALKHRAEKQTVPLPLSWFLTALTKLIPSPRLGMNFEEYLFREQHEELDYEQ